MDLLSSGATGMVFAGLMTMIFVNLCKAGWAGAISRWVNASVDKQTYGRRVLIVSVLTALVITAIQWAALNMQQGAGAMNVWLYLLRVMGCAICASGCYEYIKNVTKTFPDVKGGDADVDKG